MGQLDLWGNPVEEPDRPGFSLIPLNFAGRDVRMILIKGCPWWILADVARILHYRDAEKAARLLRDKHKGTLPRGTPGALDGMMIVNQSGLYRLMMRSNRPEAEQFQDWITDEVLPEIQKTGTYSLRGKRANREAIRLGVNLETAKVRCDQFALNKLTNRGLADEGACPNDFAAYHNAVYRGQFGDEAPGLRLKLGQRPWETPLDRMGWLPLLANAHIKAVASERIKALGPELPATAKLRILEETAREMAAADAQKLGPSLLVGLKEDPKRGTIIDVVRNELAAG